MMFIKKIAVSASFTVMALSSTIGIAHAGDVADRILRTKSHMTEKALITMQDAIQPEYETVVNPAPFDKVYDPRVETQLKSTEKSYGEVYNVDVDEGLQPRFSHR